MTKVKTSKGYEYEYVGTIFKGREEVLRLLAELKELDVSPDIAALGMRMMQLRKEKK